MTGPHDATAASAVAASRLTREARPPDRPAEVATATARVLERVAALVGGGLPPRRAWRIVAAREPAIAPLVVACDAGEDLVAAIARLPGPAWAQVAAMWRVAERMGAPAGPALGAAAAAFRDVAEGERAVEVALAGPRASARIVLALPLVGVLFGLLSGADALRFLLLTPLGWASIVVAVGLVALARAWTAALVRRARPDGPVPGLVLEAWAIAVSGGAAWSTAERVVAESVVPPPDAEARAAAETLAVAAEAGVPAAALLRTSALDVRRRVVADRLAAAERLNAQLVVPLGLCVLPAFVLVGVVPVVVGIASSTIAAVT
ncbi:MULTISPECIES: type II secretion system F family protein [unclassified Curtobacterium]|uniref:type II secretion system F family protein n=1 Tax=unclassified Curtobacterium TaxID=257496 RepID=UPI000DA878A5|nr:MULTISPECIES: type II secretion system F family protein [unclassified Curtobacterium]WIB62631.1 type II secretion system F family protein [Curtobacterium sp. MCBD17_040]WIB66468.1 type II secretion system F family protein [Curtobacterium sp. MCBD17_035]